MLSMSRHDKQYSHYHDSKSDLSSEGLIVDICDQKVN